MLSSKHKKQKFLNLCLLCVLDDGGIKFRKKKFEEKDYYWYVLYLYIVFELCIYLFLLFIYKVCF